MTEMTLGQKLKAWRDAEGLTQEQAADVVGISNTYISELENGNREEISRNVIKKYMAASKGSKLELSANDFFNQ